MKYYTGVGSRRVPEHIEQLMTEISKKLNSIGYKLRSGGASGSDKAFELGAGSNKKIYFASDATAASMDIAKKYHPAWDRMSDYAKKLHGRNSFQVLGDNLDTPSKFVICWTPDGCICHADRTIHTGGTGTAISIASENGVPVFNLQRVDHLKRLQDFVDKK